MANTIRLKQGTGSDPSASDLVLGEPAIRTDTGEIFLKKDDGTIAKVAGGIDDGDKGDITVSNDGATFTIDSGAVTYAKMGGISTNRLMGRISSGSGSPETLTPANVRTIINVEDGATADQTASDIKTLLQSDKLTASELADEAVTNAKLGDLSINNAKVASNAAIAGTKISPDFGSLNITTTGTFGSNHITVTSNVPKISLVDTDNNSDFDIRNTNGVFSILDTTNSASRFYIDSSGTVDVVGNLDVGAGIDVTGNITATGNVEVTGNIELPTVNTYIKGNGSNSVLQVDATRTYFYGGSDGIQVRKADNSTHIITVDNNGNTTVAGNVDVGAGLDVTGNITVSGTVDGVDVAALNASAFKKDGTDNGASTLRVDGADFIVKDDTDSTTNYIWRDHSADTLYLGTANAVVTPRSSVIPSADSTYNIGSSSTRFANIYGDNIYGDGSNLTSLPAGQLTGTVAAARLDTATTQSAGNNSTKIATTAYTDTAISNLINGAPAALDTLNELAAAMNDDAAFSTTVTNSLATKLPLAGGQITGNITCSGSQTFDGRDLSVDGSKLDGIESGATADQSASEILTLIKTVDGSGSGLDADNLDGRTWSTSAGNSTIVSRNGSGYIYGNYFNGSGTFATSANSSGMGRFTGTNGSDTFGRSYTAAAARTLLNVEDGATADQSASEILTLLKTVDGGGSGLDADYLDGVSSGSFLRSDADDTATGTLTVRDVKLAAGYHLQRSDHHSGHLEGTYNNVGNNSTKSNPIYSIGSSYNPADASLSNFYGVGYSHTNASFISFTGASGWGFYVAANGSATINLCGSNGVISSTGQHYVGSNVVWNAGNDGSGSGLDADLWDGNQFSSYLNQAVLTSSNPTFNNVYVNSWFRNNDSGDGLYNTATGQHWYSDHDDYWNVAGGGSANGIRFRDSHAGTIRGYVYANSSNQIGFLDSDGNWAVRVDRDVSVDFRVNSTVELTVLPDTVRCEGAFFENSQTVAANKTISNGYNAMSAGPITINSGITVTVGSGENWTIV